MMACMKSLRAPVLPAIILCALLISIGFILELVALLPSTSATGETVLLWLFHLCFLPVFLFGGSRSFASDSIAIAIPLEFIYSYILVGMLLAFRYLWMSHGSG